MKGSCFVSTEFIQKLVSEVEDGPNAAEGGQREVNNLYPLLMQHNAGRDSWNKGKRSDRNQHPEICSRQTNGSHVMVNIKHSSPSFFFRG